VTDNGVTILGYRNWPSRIAVAASQLYARNLLTFLTTFWDKDTQTPKLVETDDLIKGVLLTRGGQIVHANFAPAGAAPAGAAPAGAAPAAAPSASAA
jgi:NAD(P) transhydrogenase subunit alpha